MKALGGCHCGAVRFEAQVADHVELHDCNCSICSKTGYLHMFVAHGDFTLLGDPALSRYSFGTGAAKHLFCPTCGIKSFYQPRSHPDCWSVNFRCLDPDARPMATIVQPDGRNWEAAYGNSAD